MHTQPLLSIIVVSYNTAQLTVDTLISIEKSLVSDSILSKKLEIIVIDNASNDDSVKKITALKHTAGIPIQLIQNTANLGFGVANNSGITVSKGKYLLFLNSDTIVQSGALEHLVTQFSKHEHEKAPVGILAANLKNQDGTPQLQGGELPTLLTLAIHMTMLDDLPIIGNWLPTTQKTGFATMSMSDADELVPMGWVGGTALLTSAEVLKEIGPFDQNIFMYGEDTELCYRARNHGYQVAIDAGAKITHLQNKSSSSLNALEKEFEGIIYIFSKHGTSLQTTIAQGLIALGAFLRIIVFSVMRPNTEKVQLDKKGFRTMLS